MSFSLDDLILNEHELLEHEIARTEAELDAAINSNVSFNCCTWVRMLKQRRKCSTNSRQRSHRGTNAKSKSLPPLRS